MVFGKEIGLNDQNKEDREIVKKEDEMTNWKRNPVWLQTLFIGLILVGFVVLNWSGLSTGITTMVTHFLSFKLVDLFALSFIFNLLAAAYMVLVIIWTGNITNKLVYAKLFKKRTLWVLTDDRVLDLYLPDTKEKGFWRVKGYGRWKTLDRAMFWLRNGSLSMLAIEDHAEGVCLKDIVDKVILKGDPKHFEKRVDVAYLEGIEQSDNPLKNIDPMQVFILLLGVGIAGYLLMMALQSNECQNTLINMAKTCGDAGQNVINATVKSGSNPIKDSLNVLKP